MGRPTVMWIVVAVCVLLFVATFVMAHVATSSYREQMQKQRTGEVETVRPALM